MREGEREREREREREGGEREGERERPPPDELSKLPIPIQVLAICNGCVRKKVSKRHEKGTRVVLGVWVHLPFPFYDLVSAFVAWDSLLSA